MSIYNSALSKFLTAVFLLINARAQSSTTTVSCTAKLRNGKLKP